MSQHTGGLGDAPIEPELHGTMNALAHGLDEIINGKDTEPKDKKFGFCLMVFPFAGFDGRANYVSNAKREDVVTLLKEQLARFEGQAEMQGKA
jgi:hypothetical protein